MSTRERFDPPGYTVYCNLEELLLKGAAGSNFSEQLRKVSGMYHESDASELKVQLSNLATQLPVKRHQLQTLRWDALVCLLAQR